MVGQLACQLSDAREFQALALERRQQFIEFLVSRHRSRIAPSLIIDKCHGFNAQELKAGGSRGAPFGQLRLGTCPYGKRGLCIQSLTGENVGWKLS